MCCIACVIDRTWPNIRFNDALYQRVQVIAGVVPARVARRNRKLFQSQDPLDPGDFVFFAAPVCKHSTQHHSLHVVLWSEPGAPEGHYALEEATTHSERRPSPLVRAPRWALRREHRHPLWRIADQAPTQSTRRALQLRHVRNRVEELVGPAPPCIYYTAVS